MNVSVLCPTRGRPELLLRSYESLISTASDPSSVEVFAALDPDDPSGYAWEKMPRVRWWVAPQRFGYVRLHEYYNALAALATGQRLLVWNDDAVMLTHGWDEVIACSPPRLFWLNVNHHVTGNLFPAWPREWTDRMGHVSLSPNVDRWLSEIARSQGLEVRVPVDVYHERADITGCNRDLTYLEGRHVMGDADDSQFYSEENCQARSVDARIVSDLVYGETPR